MLRERERECVFSVCGLYLSVCECEREGKGVKGIFGISRKMGPDHVDCLFKKKRNDTRMIFLQQILTSRLLLVVIVELKK